MTVRRLFSVLSSATLISGAALIAVIGVPSAAANPCPDVEVIFARGTAARVGMGKVGDAFVESLRSKVGDLSVQSYAVNYPAGFNFAKSAPEGAADASARVLWMAENCPDTKLVLGGLSQGAGVIDLITVDPHPHPRYTPTPLPIEVADHVAAVAVFGNPMRNMDGAGPLTEMSSTYGHKSIDLCAEADPFCSSGLNLLAHFGYANNGMVDQAADFVVERLQA